MATGTARSTRRGDDLFRGTPLAVPRTSLVVPAAAALGGLAFFLWKPGVALAAVGSPRASGFTAGVGLLVVLLGWGLPRLRGGPVLTMTAQAVPVLLAFVVTVLPAFRVVTVEDEAPAAATSAPAADVTERSAAALRGIDHDATGRVLLLDDGSGGVVVRFEDLDVEPGPDYFVHLVPGAGREDPDGGVRLAKLRGNRGDQNYAVPPGTAVDRPVTVLIWCRAFAVPVAAATLG